MMAISVLPLQLEAMELSTLVPQMVWFTPLVGHNIIMSSRKDVPARDANVRWDTFRYFGSMANWIYSFGWIRFATNPPKHLSRLTLVACPSIQPLRSQHKPKPEHIRSAIRSEAATHSRAALMGFCSPMTATHHSVRARRSPFGISNRTWGVTAVPVLAPLRDIPPVHIKKPPLVRGKTCHPDRHFCG